MAGRSKPLASAAALTLLLLVICGHQSAARELGSRGIKPPTGDLGYTVGGRRRLAQSTVLDLAATTTSGGKTPAIIGVNVGHRYPGSNWPLWMRRLGVNGARVFLTSLWGSSLQSFVGGSTAWGKALDGTYVNSQADFTTAVSVLRSANGRDPSKASLFANPVKWATFDAKFTTTVTSAKADEQEGNHNATLATLATLQPEAPLVVIGCGAGSVKDSALLDTANSSYWRSHWELYKHYYAFSRYLWLRGVSRIELYNEPDLDNDFQNADGSFKVGQWLDTMTVRSRATQDLYADMNADPAFDSRPDISPNVHIGAFAKTRYNLGNLGQPTVQAMQRTFARSPNPDPSWRNLQTYSYHSYGQSGKGILSNFRELYANTSADRTALGSFPFSVSEFNAKTSGDFSTVTSHMDTPAEAAKFASQALNYVTAGADLASIYAFKFSVTLSSSNGVAKNGIHWGDNIGTPYDIGDSTLGAEGLRLIAEHLAGAKDILRLNSATASTLTDTKVVAVRDGPNYWVYMVNTGTSTVPISLSMSGWGIGAGVPVVVERMNATHYGEVSELLTTANGGAVSVPAYTDNLVRIKVPAVPVTQQTLAATAAVHVRAGTASGTNYGSSTTMCAGTTTGTMHNNTHAAVLRFTVANPANVTSAVLRLTVSSLSASTTDNMPLLLLGISNNAWTATGVTWTGLAGATGPLKAHPPAGAASTWAVNSISTNFINWTGHPGLSIQGHVTLPPVTTTKAVGLTKHVDVTPFVKASSGPVSFVLVRPFRNNQEVASGSTMAADKLNGGAVACFHSAIASTAANRPSLLLQYQ